MGYAQILSRALYKCKAIHIILSTGLIDVIVLYLHTIYQRNLFEE